MSLTSHLIGADPQQPHCSFYCAFSPTSTSRITTTLIRRRRYHYLNSLTQLQIAFYAYLNISMPDHTHNNLCQLPRPPVRSLALCSQLILASVIYTSSLTPQLIPLWTSAQRRVSNIISSLLSFPFPPRPSHHDPISPTTANCHLPQIIVALENTASTLRQLGPSPILP
ncbi:hypothetical protein BDQ17DRAFT_1429765 [Cyathus striatus]|nr:hypothetical protein BDQ17DRAFT_1429765 [Cyathus striatus]